MRKVVLNMKEQRKYDVIKNVAAHEGNKTRASAELGCTMRTVNRLVAGYRSHGKAFFSHKNKGRKPASALSDQKRHQITELYNTKYYDASYEFFTELLAKTEGIYVSVSTVRNILMGQYILSPKANRKTVKRIKKELESRLQKPVSKRTKAQIQRRLIDIGDAHPRRPRRANFGEELQMDASVHNWFGGKDSYLHAAIDDATGIITGAYFDNQETLYGYYNVFAQTLKSYGIPYKFRTDRRTVFEYKYRNSADVENDTYTQFAYACSQLGVHIETTSIPQAKGRIERLFQTLQGRLPILFRLAGIYTTEAANEFMHSYVNEFNAKFASAHNAIPSVFEKQPSDETINLTLAVISGRTIDAGHALRFENKYFRTIGKNGNPIFLEKGGKGLVIKAFDGNLFFSVDDTVMALQEIPFREECSKEFSSAPVQNETRKLYIPDNTHPWRKSIFDGFCRKMKHRGDMSPVA